MRAIRVNAERSVGVKEVDGDRADGEEPQDRVGSGAHAGIPEQRSCQRGDRENRGRRTLEIVENVSARVRPDTAR